MMRARSTLLAIFVVASLPAPVRGQTSLLDAAQRVDAIFKQWSTLESPGCAVAVAQKGLTVLSRAYGMADLEHNVPNVPGTIFEGGSVSKQFTAAAIILLAIDGKLSLNDDVRSYIPEVPVYSKTVTLRHMMNHTSGLRDWGAVASISGWGRQERTHTHAHVIDILSRQSALNFDPGHEYSYSNSGYNLLAIVVTRTSGMAFAEFSKKRIFEPLGMTNTQWRDDFTRIVKGRSSAYSLRDGAVGIMRPIENVHGNGGILTTVGDLLIWNQALTEGRLGGPRFTKMMLERGVLNNGRQIFYASGLRIDEFAGVPSITHTGSTSGYRAFLGRYPEQELSIAMLCNASNVSTGGTGGKIARVYLGDAAQPVLEPQEQEVSVAELSQKVGLYRSPETGAPLQFALKDGQLEVEERRLLIPVASNEFHSDDSRLRFVFDSPANGGRPSVTMRQNGTEDMHFEPVEDFKPTASALVDFEGAFHSEDAETTLVLKVVDGELVAHRRPDWTVTLEPEYSDAFDAPGFGLIRFHRDAAGKVVEFSLRQGRVYDMRFQRLEGAATRADRPFASNDSRLPPPKKQ